MAHEIPCPDCNTPIPADMKMLISENNFSCPNCGIQIALDKRASDKVTDTFKSFEEMKKRLDGLN